MLRTADENGMFNTALNAGTQLWRAGCWIRALLLAGLWITLAWAPLSELPRAAAQLLVTTLALLLAFAHVMPGGLNVLARLPGMTKLANHLAGTSGRATVDVSGLAEGLGALLAIWLFVGWFPLTGLPVGARATGLALAIGYTWGAVLQAVIDPGWYNPDAQAQRPMRVFRYLIPVIFSGIITFVLLPWTAAAAQVPLAIRILLSVSPFAYYLAWAAFEVMLRASVASLQNSESLWRWDVWGDVHGSMKNTLIFLQQYVDEPEADLEEIRSLARNALVVVDEFRGYLVGGRSQAGFDGALSELWESVLRGIGSPRRVHCILAEDSAGLRLSATDYQVARRVLPDLISNALKAGATNVHARCTVTGQPAVIRIEVADDGAGMEPADADNPRSSLGLLGARLHMREGGVDHSANARGGTTAAAYWRVDPAFDAESAKTP
jgi:signal transduction histidine kinase